MQLKEVNYNMGNVIWKEMIVKSSGVVVNKLFDQEPSIQSSGRRSSVAAAMHEQGNTKEESDSFFSLL